MPVEGWGGVARNPAAAAALRSSATWAFNFLHGKFPPSVTPSVSAKRFPSLFFRGWTPSVCGLTFGACLPSRRLLSGERHARSGAAFPGGNEEEEEEKTPSCVSLRRVLIVSKQTKFEAALAEKVAEWRRQHRPRRREDDSLLLYTPGSPAFEAAAAEAEARAADELAMDFPEAHRSHVTHSRVARQVRTQLRDLYGLHVTVVKARTLQGLAIDILGAALPPDAVFSAGGPWLFGINSDPKNSEGRLCVRSDESDDARETANGLQFPTAGVRFETPRIPGTVEVEALLSGGRCDSPSTRRQILADAGSKARVDGSRDDVEEEAEAAAYVASALKKVFCGGASVVQRRRIRCLLRYPPHMRQEVEERVLEAAESSIETQSDLAQRRAFLHSSLSSSSQDPRPAFLPDSASVPLPSKSSMNLRCSVNAESQMLETALPLLAVNDVLVAHCDVARSLHAEVTVDGVAQRTRSSGILVSTGTGSSAWMVGMSAVCSEQAVAIAEELRRKFPDIPTDAVTRAASSANERLALPPSSRLVRFKVREPILNRVSACTSSMGAASKVVVKPLGPHAVAIIDAMKTIPLPALVELELSIHPRDVLWTAT